MSALDPSASPTLASYLAKVRGLAWRRHLGLSGLALLVALVGCALFATGVSAATSRGDLGQILGLALAGLALVLIVLRLRQLAARSFAQDGVCARAIASTPDPSPSKARLRQDIASAYSMQTSPADPGQSQALADLFVTRVQAALPDLPPQEALLPPRRAPWWIALGVLSVILGGALSFDPVREAAMSWILGEDRRPPRAPLAFWQDMGMQLEFPPHTQRPPEKLHHVTGELSLPYGTRVTLWVDLKPSAGFAAMRILNPLGPDEIPMHPAQSSAPERVRYRASFEVRAPMQLQLQATRVRDDFDRPHHALAASITPDIDTPARIELAPSIQVDRSDREARFEIPIEVRDDHGLLALDLMYERQGQEPSAVPIPIKPNQRHYKATYAWDLSAIPVEERASLVYWIRAKDNDPGLGPQGPFSPPGKISTSTRKTLELLDARADHQENLYRLAALRDQSVDLLAKVLLPASGGLLNKVQRARAQHRQSEQFLTNLAALIDRMSTDRHSARSTLRVLSEIHARILSSHEEAEPILRFMAKLWQPETQRHGHPSAGPLHPDRLRAALNEWTRLMPALRVDLEDDVIRLDDLVDAELIEQMQSLLARVQASQTLLVEWLEQMDKDKPSDKARIEQLQRRIEMDMQRLKALQERLREEVDPGFFNEDALSAMAERMKHLSVLERLASGDVQGAKESAKSQLDALQSLREDLAQKPAPTEHLSPKEKAIRYLRKALAQIKDDQQGLTQESQASEQAEPQVPDQANSQAFAKDLQARFSKIKDTELGRPSRRSFERARDALESLATPAKPRVHAQDYERLFHELSRSQSFAPPKQKAKLGALKKLAAPKAQKALRGQALPKLSSRQGDIASALSRLPDDEEAQKALELKHEQTLERAARWMRESQRALSQGRQFRASLVQATASELIDEVLAQLEDPPPPPPPSSSEPVSTQADQDTSLRSAVLRALKEHGKDSLSPRARKYYESLLKP